MSQWFCLSHGLGRGLGQPRGKLCFFQQPEAGWDCTGWTGVLGAAAEPAQGPFCASCRAVNPLKDGFLLFPEVLPLHPGECKHGLGAG